MQHSYNCNRWHCYDFSTTLSHGVFQIHFSKAGPGPLKDALLTELQGRGELGIDTVIKKLCLHLIEPSYNSVVEYWSLQI